MNDTAIRQALRFPPAFVRFDPETVDEAIHVRFERCVRTHPDAVAVRFGRQALSYAQLNRSANHAARLLLSRAGEGPVPVAMLVDQGLPLVVWILGILKAGCAYVPLDTRLPLPALTRMIDALGPRAVIADGAHRPLAAGLANGRFPAIDAESSAPPLAQFSDDDLGLAVHADAFAYVFYTSGSTGAPKGVADTHRNVMHNVMRYTNSLGFAAGDRMSLVQSPSFSGTVSSLFGALLNGATSVLFDLQAPAAESIGAWARRERITVFHSVPAILRQLAPAPDRYPDLRLIRVEGDRATSLDLQLFKDRFDPRCVLVNGLGATECGLVRQYFVGSTTPPAPGGALPIGFAVPDMEVRVVDDDDRSLACGEVGEIVVESCFLAWGYWNDPALTARTFVQGSDGRRRYRTGDLGKFDEDGCLTLLGRRDQQPKIAGRFVDTGEVEGALHAIPGIRQAVVHFYRDVADEPHLAAYLVAATAPHRAPTVGELRAHLEGRIATAIMPSAFIYLDELPLTSDCKVDRRRLPVPTRVRPTLSNAHSPATTPAEAALCRIWSEVLEIDDIGVDDPFFDLGGDSLRAARIIARVIESALPGFARAGIVDLFEHRTVRELAAALGERTGGAWASPSSDANGGQPSQPAGTEGAAGARVSPEPVGMPAHAIAVIGLAARFPGAADMAAFWDILRQGRETLRVVDDPAARAAGAHDRIAVRGLLDNVDAFDAGFFGLTPRQAEALDPQQRVWLECVQHALEDAGLPWADGSAARIGVFAGGRDSTYLWDRLGGDAAAVDRLLRQDSDDAHLLRVSNDTDSIATRTSFLFDLTGPSVNIQSACSTSLVAIAQACGALVAGGCDAAIAGGVSITFPQQRSYRYFNGGIQSYDGHCRAFDANASGTVFGDGVGVAVLKRLSDALADGDRIHAVIRGWAVNNDGAAKASFTAPSANGQAAVIVAAQDHAKVDARAVSYVEAHGTATRIGDPIEVEALTRAFRRGTADTGFCALGSAKTNVGHLDTAAGVAGFIKTVLALKHREIPPSLHFCVPNPAIDFASSPFFVADRLLPWQADGGALIAGVSAFGVGGTNCHLILEEAPPASDAVPAGAVEAAPSVVPDPDSDPHSHFVPQTPPAELLTLSARTPEALAALAARYRDFLDARDPADWPAIAAATQRSRGDFEWRLAVLARDRAELREQFDAVANPDEDRSRTATRHRDGPARWRGRARARSMPKIGFVFTGQDAQYFRMGRGLYRTEPEFRRALDLCDQALRAHLPSTLRELMFDGSDPTAIDRTDHAQPALFALGWSLARLLMSWGIRPDAVVGHSVGEYVAACIAGVFSVEEGLATMVARGRLMQSTDATGRMLAVMTSAARIEPLVQAEAAEASIAAINASDHTVISGSTAAIARIASRLQLLGVPTLPLKVSRAFHSPLVDPVLEPLRAHLAGIRLNAPSMPLISNLHGAPVGREVTDPAYWRDHARQAVRFEACVRAMRAAGCDLFVEIGPHAVLTPMICAILADANVGAVATLRRGADDRESMLRTLGALHAGGARIDWRAVQQRRRHAWVDLPRYPFQRKRYWYDDAGTAKGAARHAPARHAPADRPAAGEDPLLGHRIRLPGSAEVRFEALFSHQRPTFLDDHRLFGIPVVPGASHFAMLIRAAQTLDAAGPVAFERLFLLRPLMFPGDDARHVQLVFQPQAEGWSLRIASAATASEAIDPEAWTVHMIGDARRAERGTLAPPPIDVTAFRNHATRALSGESFYSRIWANQGGTGSAFRWIDAIWQGDGEALCHTTRPDVIDSPHRYLFHPGLVEAACQVLHACGTIETLDTLEREGVTYVPFSVERLVVFPAASSEPGVWCHARMRHLAVDSVIGDLTITDATGRILTRIEGFCLRRIGRDAITERSVGAGPAAGTDEALIAPPSDDGDRLAYLQRQCAEISGYSQSEISADASFAALGMDSVMAVMLANRIRRDFGTTVDVAKILTIESIAALADEIGNSLPRS